MLLAGAHFLLRPSNGLALLAGLAGGLALATRPAIALLLAAAVPLVFVIAMVRRRRVFPALAAAMLFAVGAAAPVAPVLLRNVTQYGTINLTSQTGQHLAFWIVPLVTQRADGTPYQTSVDRMQALYQQRLAERGLRAETNPFRLAAIRTEVAREEMARLPLAAYAKAWLEGMAVNLGAPALLADPRVRALPKPSFYNTAGTSLWERARAYVFDDPGRYQVLLIAGLIGMLPFLALEAIGFVMLARMLPWAAILCGRRAGLFPPAQRTGRDRQISAADGAGADRIGSDPFGLARQAALPNSGRLILRRLDLPCRSGRKYAFSRLRARLWRRASSRFQSILNWRGAHGMF